jgi:hypothetical protein
VSEAQFFFPKRKREFSFTAQRGEGARARNAVEDLNRGYRCAALGVSLFKPQTVLFALEPRRGKRRHSPAPVFELESFGASIKTWISEKSAHRSPQTSPLARRSVSLRWLRKQRTRFPTHDSFNSWYLSAVTSPSCHSSMYHKDTLPCSKKVSPVDASAK